MTPRQAFISVRQSYWFVPALLVLSCALLAIAMVEVDARLPARVLDSLPRLFGAGAEGSRAVLSAIATSTMTVAGVVFSINIVALSLATAQYSPHVLQNFTRDRANQTVLGVFLGIFTYCLIVLRTVRGGDESFVPAASIVIGILLALLGVAFLIFFIHHVSVSIQVSHIVSHIAAETRAVIERIYPEDGDRSHGSEPGPLDEGVCVRMTRPPGYVQHIDYEGLADIAVECGALVRVPLAVGDFARTGEALVVLHGVEGCGEKEQARIRRAFACGNSRDIEQDPAFGLQQLVDVACRALSSSNNDTTTALHALEQLTVLLSMLGERDVDARRVMERDGRPVLVSERLAFGDFVQIVAAPFRHYSRTSPLVLGHLARSLERVAGATTGDDQLAEVLEHLGRLEETLAKAGFETADEDRLKAQLDDTRRRLDALALARRRSSPSEASCHSNHPAGE